MTLAGEAEIAFEVLFGFGGSRETIHPLHDLHHTFLAFALFLAGGGNTNAKLFRVIKERRPRRGLP
jgi:hypothetical protein